MKRALGSGLVGALGVTAFNQIGKRYLPEAPRLDVLGLRLAAAAFRKAGRRPPGGWTIRMLALVGDLVSNSLFFGLVGLGGRRAAVLRGGALGLAMGIEAVTLPEPLGVGGAPSARTRRTAAQTILWYVAGGMLAAFTYAWTHRDRHRR